jgi:hypothetical protein
MAHSEEGVRDAPDERDICIMLKSPVYFVGCRTTGPEGFNNNISGDTYQYRRRIL